MPLPITRGDMEDAAWLLSRALTAAGVGRDDVLSASPAHPAVADAALRLKAAFSPTGAGATVCVGDGPTAAPRRVVAGVDFLETPETGVFAVRSGDGFEALGDAHVVERDRRRDRRDAARPPRAAAAAVRDRPPLWRGRTARSRRSRSTEGAIGMSLLLTPVTDRLEGGQEPGRLHRARLVPRLLPPGHPGRPVHRLRGAPGRGRHGADHPADDARAPLEPRARALHVRPRRPPAQARADGHRAARPRRRRRPAAEPLRRAVPLRRPARTSSRSGASRTCSRARARRCTR